MRLLWVYTLTLAFILAIVFQDVNGDEQHKKGAGNKGIIHRDGDDMEVHHPDAVRGDIVPGGRSGDRSSSNNRDRSGTRGHSSSSDKHKSKSPDRKHHDKKNRKDKHNKHHNKKNQKDQHNKHRDGTKHHRGNKNSQ